MPADGDRSQTNVAWLETLVAENGDTIEQHPDSTIVPPPAATDEERAALGKAPRKPGT